MSTVSAGDRHNYRDGNLLGRPECLPPALFHYRSAESQDAQCVWWQEETILLSAIRALRGPVPQLGPAVNAHVELSACQVAPVVTLGFSGLGKWKGAG